MTWYNPMSWFGSRSAERKASASANKNAAKTDATQAGQATSNAVNNTAQSIKDGTTAVGEGASAKAHEATHQAENAVEGASHSAADKTKHRPGVRSHDSVGDKIRHAFKIDHKDHHKTAPAVESNPVTTV